MPSKITTGLVTERSRTDDRGSRVQSVIVVVT
jgi:hypothetical protein